MHQLIMLQYGYVEILRIRNEHINGETRESKGKQKRRVPLKQKQKVPKQTVEEYMQHLDMRGAGRFGL